MSLSTAQATERVALVVGNGLYRKVPTLHESPAMLLILDERLRDGTSW
jgi:hypothetical protein